jgi:hypothetical protein
MPLLSECACCGADRENPHTKSCVTNLPGPHKVLVLAWDAGYEGKSFSPRTTGEEEAYKMGAQCKQEFNEFFADV